jgi:hypothetical protein
VAADVRPNDALISSTLDSSAQAPRPLSVHFAMPDCTFQITPSHLARKLKEPRTEDLEQKVIPSPSTSYSPLIDVDQ